MEIVTDSGTDVWLSAQEAAELHIHTVPLVVTLDGQSYREGIDIQPGGFYQRLAETESLPMTSQPSAGEFATLYEQLAAGDDEILSIHMSSGLSGTLNAAKAGAALAPEAHVTHVDTKTLSVAAGWQVEAAARAGQAGWPVDRILELLARIRDATETLYTLQELKYLIHGGRISHLKGLIATVLHIKPLIGVEKENGTYTQIGQMRTFKRAIAGIVDRMAEQHAPGSALRVQVAHAYNPSGADQLRASVDERFDCTWLPVGPISPVLGAHTGPTMIGVAYAPAGVFEDVPGL